MSFTVFVHFLNARTTRDQFYRQCVNFTYNTPTKMLDFNNDRVNILVWFPDLDFLCQSSWIKHSASTLSLLHFPEQSR